MADEPNPELETHLKQRWLERNISDKERVALLQAAGPLGAVLIGDDTARWVAAPVCYATAIAFWQCCSAWGCWCFRCWRQCLVRAC